jgi:hypothetical protein
MKAGLVNTEEPMDDSRDVHDQARIDDIVEAGPSGAFAVAGVAVATVIALWFAFYFFVYLPRGAVQ